MTGLDFWLVSPVRRHPHRLRLDGSSTTRRLAMNAPRVLSLGAGVQSTALLLLSIDGHLPPVQHAIFADTGWEPEAVYQHLDRLANAAAEHGIDVRRVAVGNIRADALDPNHRFASMPLFWKSPEGKPGMGRRQCTSEYKLRPIKEEVRRILGATPKANGRPGGVQRGLYVENWVGISTDEVGRIRPSDVSYMRRRDPLVDDLDMSRADCVAYLTERWPHPVERSACIGCPFHSNDEWRAIQLRPKEWADAVDFDRHIRAGNARAALTSPARGEAFLHASRIPLDQVDLSVPDPELVPAQMALFGAGDFGCSPFDCRRGAA